MESTDRPVHDSAATRARAVLQRAESCLDNDHELRAICTDTQQPFALVCGTCDMLTDDADTLEALKRRRSEFAKLFDEAA